LASRVHGRSQNKGPGDTRCRQCSLGSSHRSRRPTAFRRPINADERQPPHGSTCLEPSSTRTCRSRPTYGFLRRVIRCFVPNMADEQLLALTAEMRALVAICYTDALDLGRHRAFYLPACDCIAFSICSLTVSRLKLAPFCIGGKSIAVWASFPTSCCTNWKRQNS